MNKIFKPKTKEEIKILKNKYLTEQANNFVIKKGILDYLFDKGFILDTRNINGWNFYFKSEKYNDAFYINRLTSFREIKAICKKIIKKHENSRKFFNNIEKNLKKIHVYSEKFKRYCI